MVVPIDVTGEDDSGEAGAACYDLNLHGKSSSIEDTSPKSVIGSIVTPPESAEHSFFATVAFSILKVFRNVLG